MDKEWLIDSYSWLVLTVVVQWRGWIEFEEVWEMKNWFGGKEESDIEQLEYTDSF